MSQEISVSVVIVTFNRADSLRETLTSMVHQEHRPDEVIVVDNNSTDHTHEVVQEFVRLLSIRYVCEERRGIPYARNAGIEAATKDIIAFIDDDCVADADWLKHLLAPFIRDPNIGAVGGGVAYLKSNGGIVDRFYRENMPPHHST